MVISVDAEALPSFRRTIPLVGTEFKGNALERWPATGRFSKTGFIPGMEDDISLQMPCGRGVKPPLNYLLRPGTSGCEYGILVSGATIS